MNPIAFWDYENLCWTIRIDDETFDSVWELLRDNSEWDEETDRLSEAFLHAVQNRRAVDEG